MGAEGLKEGHQKRLVTQLPEAERPNLIPGQLAAVWSSGCREIRSLMAWGSCSKRPGAQVRVSLEADGSGEVTSGQLVSCKQPSSAGSLPFLQMALRVRALSNGV